MEKGGEVGKCDIPSLIGEVCVPLLFHKMYTLLELGRKALSVLNRLHSVSD